MILALLLAGAALAVPPEPIDPASWITSDDYPPAALRNHIEGKVRFALDVDADGAISDCTIIQSSGNAELDDQTCALMRIRGRFKAGRDLEGRPAAARIERAVTWQIPTAVAAFVGTQRHTVTVRATATGAMECVIDDLPGKRITANGCKAMVDAINRHSGSFPITDSAYFPESWIEAAK